MRKKVFAIVAACLLSLSMLSACGEPVESVNSKVTSVEVPASTSSAEVEPTASTIEEPATEPETGAKEENPVEGYFSFYQETIDNVKTALEGEDLGDDYFWATMLMEIDNIGYDIQEISGDSIPELIFGAIEDGEESGSQIYAIYTIVDGKAVLTVDATGRSYAYYHGNGSFIYGGSSGAAYYSVGEYVLSEDGSELQAKDYYFSHETDETFEEIAVYHNNTGDWSVEDSELTDMSVEALYQMADDLCASSENLCFVPMEVGLKASYTPLMEEDCREVTVQWASEASDISDFDEFTADYDAPSEILLSPTGNGVVNGLKIVKISLHDGNEIEDEIAFDVEELDFYEETMDKPLLLTLTFYGDIPNYGFVFWDEDDIDRYYAFVISGKDGGVELMAFTPTSRG